MLPTAPPARADALRAVRLGAVGWPVYALQKALNTLGASLVADGSFGPRTDRALRSYQTQHGLLVSGAADGIAGPKTWLSLTTKVCAHLANEFPALPGRLPSAMAHGEGGDYGPAVNWNVKGGVDCGLFQLRCYGPPFRQEEMLLAFSPENAGRAALGTIQANIRHYQDRHPLCPFSALELAVLYHNWQWAADRYQDYGVLPNPNRDATLRKLADGTEVGWVDPGLPASARTYDGWAHWYVQSMTAGL